MNPEEFAQLVRSLVDLPREFEWVEIPLKPPERARDEHW